MKSLVEILNGPSYSEYRDLWFRIKNLEASIDCLIDNKEWVASEGVGFNAQLHRKAIFKELLETFSFDAIVETGTWLGDTTGYLASVSGLSVYSCELNRRFHALAKMRLTNVPNVFLSQCDSRSFLTTLSKEAISKKFVFFYLDAHWHDDLPLQKELEILCGAWERFVVMVDDFQVPGDAGYLFDNYGKGKVLSLKTYSRLFAERGLTAFFPKAPSSEETGFQRGCVVLSRNGEFSERLAGLKSLRRSP